MNACRDDALLFAGYGGVALLDAALEAIGRAAIVVDRVGNVRHTNSIARQLLANGETSLYDTLDAVVRADGAEHPDWSRATVVTDAHGIAYLLVARRTAVGVTQRLAQAARQWSLTRRQREVLERIADGNPNKTIAAALGVSPRTVEVHLGALFLKAGVTSRAELLVKLSAIE